MEKQDKKIEKKVIRSVVVVREDGGNDCCSGFVAEIEEGGTIYVTTQSEFAEGKAGRLKVCFFEKVERTATIVVSRPPMCLLRTDFHCKCAKIEWAESCNIDIDRVLLFPPSSPTHYKRISAFASLESLESYEKESSAKYVDGSSNYFIVSCPYTERTMDGHNKLVAAPVFNEKGAIGVVLMDCFAHMGAEMKIVVRVKAMVQLLSELIPPSTSKSGELEDLKPKKRRRVKGS